MIASDDIATAFGRVARLHAERIAVEDDSGALSYRELEQLADRIRDTLMAGASEPGRPVALLLANSIRAIAAILGVLKAGSPYVVLDPAHPPTRTQRIFRSARPCVVIAERADLQVADPLSGGDIPVLGLDALGSSRPASVRAEDTPVATDATAGLFYTSGSTGEPKGVQRTHAQILQRCAFEMAADKIRPDDTISLLYSCAYGASVADIFNALLGGARLSLFDVRQRGLLALRDWISLRRVTLLHLPAVLFRQLLTTLGQGEDFSRVRQLVPSGRLFRRDVEQFRRFFPQRCVMVSRFASAETSLVARLLIDHDTRIGGEVVPVGYPVAGKRVTIVDEGLVEVAPGQVGQIVVTSDHLSPGYWGAPLENAAKFRQGMERGAERSCLTGDLGRMAADGCLELLGRLDHQLKIRGYRVDLVEVEAALRTLDGVEHVALLPREDSEREPSLACYLSFRDAVPASPAMIRSALAEQLPQYMIPSTIVVLDEMPLLPNAKIDYQGLPGPDSGRAQSLRAFVAPRSPDEARIATIWSEVLRIDEVGVVDSFVELGGHSLLASRAALLIAEQFGLEVSPADLLAGVTVAQLAARIPIEGAQDSALPPLLPCDHGEAQPLSFGQGRLWFEQQLHPQSTRYNMPKLLRLEGELDMAALERALGILLARHAVLRTILFMTDAGPMQRITEDVAFRIPVIDLARFGDVERDQQLRKEVARVVERPFDLARDPMLRVCVLRLDHASHLLLLVTHHVATDHHSSAMLLGELSTIYRCCAARLEVPLPPPRLQYIDFAAWQHRLLEGDFLALQRAYWQERLSGAPPETRFPTDRPIPLRAAAHRAGGRVSLAVPTELTRALRTLCSVAGCTMFTMLLAVVNALLFSYSGQKDLVVGAPASGRCHRGMTHVAGFFANTLALRTTLHDDPSVAGLLARCRTTTVEAYRNVQFPFEQLLQALRIRQDRGGTPMVQVVLNCLEGEAPPIDFGSLVATRLELPRTTVAFDVVFNARHGARGLDVVVEYDRGLFEEGTMQRMLHRLHRLLELMCACPDTRISGLLLQLDSLHVATAGLGGTGAPDTEAGEI